MAEHKSSFIPRSKIRLLKDFCLCESGATGIEYAMIAVGLSIVIIGSVHQIGSTVSNDIASVQTDYRHSN